MPNKYYNELINTVLDEIQYTIDMLRGNNAIAAYSTYLDFAGDVTKLNKRDYGAACALLWHSIEDSGFELYSYNDLKRNAGFQLAW